MQHQQYLLAAFKQRIAEALNDYADRADGEPDPLELETDLVRGIRFAADLVAGLVHNPHARECSCPCDKPDPALLPTPLHPTKEELQSLARIVRDAGGSPRDALSLARLIMAAGYRMTPTDMPPAPRPDGRRSGAAVEFARVPAPGRRRVAVEGTVSAVQHLARLPRRECVGG